MDSTEHNGQQNMENHHGLQQQLVSKVSMKIPPFWKKNVEIWFLQVESQFSISGITTEVTKYHHIVASLDSEVAETVSDLICKPLSNQPYTDLKNRLITQFSKSEQTKLRLLQELELGDRKPSVLLQHMRALSGNNMSDTFLKSLFVQRMPSQYRPILAANINLDIDALAKMADQTIDFSSLMVQELDNNSPATTTSQEQLTILQRLERIEEIMSRSPAFTEAVQNPKKNHFSTCWYHFKFGKMAKKCSAPCKFARQNKHSKNGAADQ